MSVTSQVLSCPSLVYQLDLIPLSDMIIIIDIRLLLTNIKIVTVGRDILTHRLGGYLPGDPTSIGVNANLCMLIDLCCRSSLLRNTKNRNDYVKLRVL